MWAPGVKGYSQAQKGSAAWGFVTKTPTAVVEFRVSGAAVGWGGQKEQHESGKMLCVIVSPAYASQGSCELSSHFPQDKDIEQSLYKGPAR